MTLLTVAEVAERLKVNAHTVYEWCWAGHLPHVRLGPTGRTVRFDEKDIDRFLAASKQGG